jgi:hypothetical protein
MVRSDKKKRIKPDFAAEEIAPFLSTTSNVWLVGICWYTRKGKPLMVVSTTISSAPTMIYFGQEVGEAGNENGGFGTHSELQFLIM